MVSVADRFAFVSTAQMYKLAVPISYDTLTLFDFAHKLEINTVFETVEDQGASVRWY